MKKKRELTWEDLRKGKEKLEKLFDSMDYAEGRFLIQRSRTGSDVFLKCYEKESMHGVAKEDPIIERRVSVNQSQVSRLEVCAFAREVYDLLMSRELDESELLDVNNIKWGLEKGEDPQLDRIKFFRSYEAVYDRKPDLLTFGISEVDTLSEEKRKRAIKILEDESWKLRVGGAVRFDGVKILRNLGLRANLGEVFRYSGDIYCTLYPETHGFKRDLERAVQYELLTV